MRLFMGTLVTLGSWLPLSVLAQDAAGTALESGRAVTAQLPSDGSIYRTYSVQVPQGARSLSIRLKGNGDVDLYLRAGRPILEDWQAEATAFSASADSSEEILLSPSSRPPLQACTYFIDVVHGHGRLAREVYEFTLVATVEEGTGEEPGAQPLLEGAGSAQVPPPSSVVATFSDDYSTEVVLSAETPNSRTFVLEVTADVESVTLTLTGDNDVDIYARHGGPMAEWATQADHRSDSERPREKLVLSRGGVPRLRTGTYYIDVARAEEANTKATLSAEFVRGYSGGETEGEAPRPSEEDGVAGEISGDSLFNITLDGDPAYRTYTINVPKEARSMLIKALGAEGDLDIFLRHGQPIESYRTDPDHRANGSRSNEQLYVTLDSTPPLEPGKYYFDLANLSGGPVGTVEVTVQFNGEAPAPLPASSGPVHELTLGERLEVKLLRAEHKAGRYRFDVPAGAASLHVAVLGATRDIDLFLRRGSPITDYHDPLGFDQRAFSARLNERLTVDKESTPPLQPGTYYLDVASLVQSDEYVQFTLIATLDKPHPLRASDLQLPPFKRAKGLTPLERALAATVQITTEGGEGSGTCLSPSGYVVTNHHVLVREGELQREAIYLSFVKEFDRPPLQLLVAEVVEANEGLDLVLLKVVRDIYDRPVSDSLNLPWIPVGDASRLHLGDPLWIAGYPSVGGFESRTSLSLTKGIVSGFTSDGTRRTWIKTDARINAGNSGGTALDPELNYVGIPSQEEVLADDELGFCRPTNLFPQRWLDLIKKDLPR